MSEPRDVDPQLLIRAGWSPEELYWEELSEAALALPHREALPYWREAAAVAPEVLAGDDARQATSLANLAMAEALDGNANQAAQLLERAQTCWEAAATWLAGLIAGAPSALLSLSPASAKHASRRLRSLGPGAL